MLALAAGCTDDRKRVAGDVFLCSPTSHTADYDCGDGFVCYSAAQSVGESMCVPECDPANPGKRCPGGACTLGHECLSRCTVGDSNGCPAGGGLLSCVRTTYSPIEVQSGGDGVCVPVAFSCVTSDDCGSPVFNLCTSETNGQAGNDALPKSGSVCAQGNCARDGVACEPGSTCIRKLLPASISDVPDVCTPNCSRRTVAGGGMVDECAVGFGCMNEAFPETNTRVCAPGRPGWLCSDPLGCTAGGCEAWSDVGGPFTQFKTCAPSCAGDADCLLYDRPGNANVLTHFTCVGGRCRNLQSLFFGELCLNADDGCRLDPAAICRISESDAGTPAPSACDAVPSAGMPLGGFGGSTSSCTRSCSSDGDCALLTSGTHVTHACAGGFCAPAVPFIVPCSDDNSCIPGLSCVTPPPGGPPYKVCTKRCTQAADCAAHPALGSSFACAANLCVPKTASGCAPPAALPDLCLSGQLGAGGLCLSPAGWVCDNEAHPEFPSRCLSGKCDRGHCQ